MENARWDESNSEKLRLEEQQRIRRRQREDDAINSGKLLPYEPVWWDFCYFYSRIEVQTNNYYLCRFRREKEEGADNSNVVHVYAGDYWICKQKQDWSRSPDIF